MLYAILLSSQYTSQNDRLLQSMDALPPNLLELYAKCVLCSANHPDCETFFRYIRPLFSRVASRVARQFGAEDEIEDIVQEISLKIVATGETILPSLRNEYASTIAYFSVLAANAARDFFRSRHAIKRGIRQTLAFEGNLDSIADEIGVPKSTEREILISQIEGRLPNDRRERAVFRLYYRRGFSAKEISAIQGLELTEKGVESMLHRITLSLRQQLRHRVGAASAKGNRSGASLH